MVKNHLQLFYMLCLCIFCLTFTNHSMAKTQKTCEKTEYQNDLFWDSKQKVYWSQMGSFSIYLNTCDINSCNHMTVHRDGHDYKYTNCLVRPDNIKNCRVPCYENKFFQEVKSSKTRTLPISPFLVVTLLICWVLFYKI